MSNPHESNIPPATLTKAVLRAAEHLGLSHALPEILGIDALATNKMTSGDYVLDPSRAEWAAATRLTGLFRTLLTLLGNADDARTWLASSHQTLGDAPLELLRTHEGREKVFKYLDAVQKYEIKLPTGKRH